MSKRTIGVQDVAMPEPLHDCTDVPKNPIDTA
jgi:hypothetical protein